MANLSKAQEKLLNRIKEVTSKEKLNSEARGEDFDGWISSADLSSKEFGWNRINIRTVIALGKSGLVSVRIFREKSEYNGKLCIEISYEFKVMENGTIEHWSDMYSAARNTSSVNYIRSEICFGKRFSVYRHSI
ncbi:hypothetical protein [Vibrio sp. D431a]|uniref:hypothetical protein n=1 Tax=Vibrio sp. D431a TaxID=2837388 RepID=UPI002552D928|nr:hypothetical protein [Vibrio sp. D431a]MDK9793705.1 hypothetical protein [Vibrio sp. D431a]